jgi:hypothetical protein
VYTLHIELRQELLPPTIAHQKEKGGIKPPFWLKAGDKPTPNTSTAFPSEQNGLDF